MTKSKSNRTKTKKMQSKKSLPKPLTKNKNFIIIAVFIAVIGVVALIRSMAAPTMWLPTADKPLTFTWVLDDIRNLSGEQVLNLQTKNLAGAPIAQADVYDIDGEYATKAQVSYLQSKGKKVICYFDAGVYEDYRADKNKFPKSVIGAPDEGWPGSFWLDIRQISILEPIMKARIQMCKDKGFDSIEPDEITNWSNDSGFPLTYQDQIKYNRALAGWAHDAGMSIGLKGNLEQAHDLVNDFDWTLNEECYQYNECTSIYNEGPGADGKQHPGLQLFVQKNKAVWIAEYKKVGTPASCTDSYKNRFNTAWYKLGLPTNGGRTDCPPFPARTTSGVTNPTVNLAASSSNLTAPANFSITATSSLSANIDILAGNSVIKSCATATTCTASVSNYQAGSYNFTAKATTPQGGSGTGSLSVTVLNTVVNKPPSVSLTSNKSASLAAPASFTLTANAVDPDGVISKVEFWRGTTKISEKTNLPYALDITNLAAGTYSYTAKAFDNAGASTTSTAFNVTVTTQPQSTDTTAPNWPTGSALTLSFSGANYNFWQGKSCDTASGCTLDLKWSNATDNKAVSGYEIWRSSNNQASTKIGTANSSTTTFRDPAINKDIPYLYQIIALDAAGNRTAGPVKDGTIGCFPFFFHWCGLK